METSPTILSESEWQARRAAHEKRAGEWTEPHLARTSLHQQHPVYDFLFDYYHFRPSQLFRWHPGLGAVLTGESAREFLTQPGYREARGGAGVEADPSWLKPQRRESVRYIRDLLRATAARTPAFGCFGLHEWAMVYRAPEVRHSSWPLRFDDDAIAAIVEAHPIRCTHFDAFRFFTPAARPLNRVQPTKPLVPSLEQRGCLHANMDLYKWAFKLTPYAPSELAADAFALAREIREIDMRASPYDLASLGFEPIRIETAEGKTEYERHQRRFAECGAPIRERIVEACERLLRALEEED